MYLVGIRINLSLTVQSLDVPLMVAEFRRAVSPGFCGLELSMYKYVPGK